MDDAYAGDPEISRLIVSTHAARRWADQGRAETDLDVEAARADLLRHAVAASPLDATPEWMGRQTEGSVRTRYLGIDEDVVLLVRPAPEDGTWVVATVVRRDPVGPAVQSATLDRRDP